MKKLILLSLFIFFLTIQNSFSQGSQITIFHQEGERFWVIIDGVRQNEKPLASVFLDNIRPEFLRVKIIFENEKIPDINQSIATRDTEKNITHAKYIIRQRKNNKTTMRLHSFEVINRQPTIATTPPVQTMPENPIERVVDVNTAIPVPNVSININLPSIDPSTIEKPENVSQNPQPIATKPIEPQANHFVMPGYTGKIGCPWPMSQNDFEAAKRTISSRSFEDSKLEIAKQIISNNCLLSSQVKSIMSLFNFETSKLDFAKFAYTRVYDIGNYFIVNEAFSFDSSTNELNNFIMSIQK